MRIDLSKRLCFELREAGIIYGHYDYPNHKSLKDMKGREPEPMFECNGFGCAVNDLMPKPEKVEAQTKLF